MKARSVVALGLTVVVTVAGCSIDRTLDRGISPFPTSATSPPSAAPTQTGVPSPSGTATPTVARSTVAIPTVTPQGFRTPPPGQGMDRYLNQPLQWQPCDRGMECATIAVPLDYNNPDGEAITLAMSKVSGGGSVQGSLFLNPGGPGGSGLAMAAGFAQAFRGDFDVIGWDPRGVGRSTPVNCMNGAELDAFYDLDSSPDTEQEQQALLDGTRKFGLSCLAQSGRLMQHISTVETVKDLDLMRHLVGDDKLNYLGFSYGTQIGATYAQLFGPKINRMVLDAAANITEDNSVIQAQGFERSLEHFADWCAAGNCSFGNSRAEVIARITDLLDRLDQQPLVVRDRQLTQSLAALGILTPLYQDEQVWPQLRQALQLAFDGDGSGLLSWADSYNDRDNSGNYGQSLFAFNAIRCLDEGDQGVAAAQQQLANDVRLAPVFGKYLGADYYCALWPVAAQPPIGKITGPGAPPIVVVGTTGDSATPYEYAVWMAAQLESGVLLTFDGEGHGAFGGGNPCVDGTVLAYLTRGRVPEDGQECR